MKVLKIISLSFLLLDLTFGLMLYSAGWESSVTSFLSQNAFAENVAKTAKTPAKKLKNPPKSNVAAKSDKKGSEPTKSETNVDSSKSHTAVVGGNNSESNAASAVDKGGKEQSSIESAVGFQTGQGNEPMFINSDTLTVESKKRIFTYTGSVKMVQGETNIDADVVVGKYDENNVIQEVICEGNVRMTKGPGLKATSNRAVYTLATHTVILTEGPEITHEGSTLTADIVRVFIDQDRSEAEGNVKVKVIKSDTKEHSDPLPKSKSN